MWRIFIRMGENCCDLEEWEIHERGKQIIGIVIKKLQGIVDERGGRKDYVVPFEILEYRRVKEDMLRYGLIDLVGIQECDEAMTAALDGGQR